MYLVGPAAAEAAVPWLRGAGGRADSGGRAEYFDRRRQRRAEPRGGRRRADATGSRSRNTSYGTSYRIINLIVGMQLLTIILSRGNVYLLAALYAFGVIWSFAMKSLAVLVLRYTEPGNRAVEGSRQPAHRQNRNSAGAGG